MRKSIMKIVLLLGPSSAGKSTTCAELQRQGWRVSSGDVVMEPLQASFPSKVREALNRKELFTKLSHLMTEDEVFKLAMEGHLVISKGDHQITLQQMNGPEYPNLSQCLLDEKFSDDEYAVLYPLLKSVGETFIEVREDHFNLKRALFDDAFNRATLEESVVIDWIPADTVRNTQDFIRHFNDRVERYRQTHGDDSIQSSIILALCTPEQLSARVLRRNAEATATGDERNKREGTFPFEQLSVLIGGGIFREAQQRVGTTTTAQMREIAYRHQRLEQSDVSTTLTSENIASDVVEAVVESVFNYAALSQGFGLNPSRETHDIAVRDEFASYPRIDTLSGSPVELARQVIAISEAGNTAALRM